MFEQSDIQEDDIVVGTEPYHVRFMKKPTFVLCKDCQLDNGDAIEVVPVEIMDIVTARIAPSSELGREIVKELRKKHKHQIASCRDCQLNASLMEGPVAL